MSYVFIHGANYDSSCWRFVVPHLDGPAVLVDLPGRGLRPAELANVSARDFGAAAAEDVERADVTNGVLVAHSAGGLTTSQLLNRMPERFRAVVLVAAVFAPHGSAMVDNIDPEVRENVIAGAGDGTYALDEETAHSILCNDLDEEMARVAISEMQSDTTSLLAEPYDLTGMRSFENITYVRTLRDLTVPQAQQEASMAVLGGCKVIDIDAGHMVMLSRPEELAKIIVEAGR
jgi:pimeloyl-ACP methyl ester carboxylesterase